MHEKDITFDNSKVEYSAYQNHQVFEQLDDMMEVYEGISYTCFGFVQHGVGPAGNYATYVYLSICSTLNSIKTLLKLGHITDAFVLIRKLFDTVLADIYLDVVREDNFDWMDHYIVKDINEWLNSNHRIPRTEKILSILKESKTTKELFPFFGWNTYLKNNREFLDNHVHANSYSSILMNCQNVYIEDRERQLKNASIILNQIMKLHLSFIFFINGHFMMASDLMDYMGMNMTPPEGSESWIAPYAQKAFDRYIKPDEKLAAFIKERCCLNIE